MISLDQAKELDDYELCEQLEKRLQILALCVEAIDTNHRGTEGLFLAFHEVGHPIQGDETARMGKCESKR